MFSAYSERKPLYCGEFLKTPRHFYRYPCYGSHGSARATAGKTSTAPSVNKAPWPIRNTNLRFDAFVLGVVVVPGKHSSQFGECKTSSKLGGISFRHRDQFHK
jgi:hypothetical protein